MRALMFLLAGSLLVLGHAPASAAAASASGTFEDSGNKRFAAVDAVAWRDGDFVHVVLSDKVFDRAAMAKDGRYEEGDLMAHPGASLNISIMAEDGALSGIRIRNDRGSGADFRCEGPGLLTVTKNQPAAIAGKFKCEGHDVTFDAAYLPPQKAGAGQ